MKYFLLKETPKSIIPQYLLITFNIFCLFLFEFCVKKFYVKNLPDALFFTEFV